MQIFLGRQVAEQLLELLRLDRLLGDQFVGQSQQPRLVLGQNLSGPSVAVLDERPNLFIDELGYVVGVVALLTDLTTQEDHLVALAEGEGTELVAHAPFGHHPASQVGGLLDVVAGAGRGVAEDQALGRVAAEQARDLVLELGLGLEIAVLGGHRHRVAEGHSAADDRHLVDRVALGQDPLHDRVAALVDGDDALLGIGDEPALSLGAGNDALQRLVELGHADDLPVAPGGQDRGFVDEVRQVGSRETSGLTSDLLAVHGLVERLALGVDVEDRHSTSQVRTIEDDLAVEAAGPKERRIENVGTVGGRDDDHVGVRVEAVHLDEDLVQGLLALVVGAAQAGAALAADRVNLVHEDDAGRVPLGLVEQIADSAGADADEHLHELGARDGEERHARFTRHGPSEKRLAGAWRADEKDAARDPGAERVELLRVLEELDDLLEIRLCLIDPRDVGKGHDRLVAEEHPRSALAEAQSLVVGALGLAHEEDDEQNDDQDRQACRDQDQDPARVRRLLDLIAHRRRDAAVLQPAVDRGGFANQGRIGLDGVGRLVLERHRQSRVVADDLRDLSRLNVRLELRIDLSVRLGRLDQDVEQQRGGGNENDHHDPVAQKSSIQRCNGASGSGRRCVAGRPPQYTPEGLLARSVRLERELGGTVVAGHATALS